MKQFLHCADQQSLIKMFYNWTAIGQLEPNSEQLEPNSKQLEPESEQLEVLGDKEFLLLFYI